MEKVTLYVKKILALLFSFCLMPLTVWAWELNEMLLLLPGLPLSFLLFSVINYKITGDKPMYLFGITQSDTHLTKKGGFWNLFKWIVNVLGILYDLLVWIFWGVFLLFMLIVDLIMLIKFVVYWIIHAIIWFIRQLFPPFIFMFKMFVHYILYWFWWIYQMTFRNMRISVNKNFYFIALWGSIPAMFIIFLFFAISQLVGVPELIVVSALFAIIPLVWSYGEISALRFEEREKDDYTSVKYKFRNGWDAVKSVLFYVIIALVLVIAEIVLNLLGWIPNLSMSLLGITLNLNMAISLVLVFLAVILMFIDSMLPTHILYHPEHENDLKSSLSFLKVIGQKFLRYIVAWIPSSFFGGLLLVIPVFIIALTINITQDIKEGVLDVKIENLQEKYETMDALDAYRTEIKIDRLNMYKVMPMSSPEYFADLRNTGDRVTEVKEDLASSEEMLITKKGQFDEEMGEISAAIEAAKADTADPALLSVLSNDRLALEEEYLEWDRNQKECIAFLGVDLKEQRSMRAQMPILYFFIGILFAVFGGLVVAVFVAYIGNVVFELYNMREDDKPTYWRETINELKAKDGNQPLLGFTFLAIIIALGVWCIWFDGFALLF